MNRLNKTSYNYQVTYLTKTKKLTKKSMIEEELQESYNGESLLVEKYKNSLLNSMLNHKVSVVVISNTILKGLVETDANRKGKVEYLPKLYKSLIAHLTKDLGASISYVKSSRAKNILTILHLPESIAIDFSTISSQEQYNKLLKLLNAEAVEAPVKASFKRSIPCSEPLKQEVATTPPITLEEYVKTEIRQVLEPINSLNSEDFSQLTDNDYELLVTHVLRYGISLDSLSIMYENVGGNLTDILEYVPEIVGEFDYKNRYDSKVLCKAS